MNIFVVFIVAGLTLLQLKELFFQFSQHVFKDGMLGLWPQAISNSLAMNDILQSVFRHKMMLDVTEPKYICHEKKFVPQ